MKKTKTWNRVLDFCPQKKTIFDSTCARHHWFVLSYVYSSFSWIKLLFSIQIIEHHNHESNKSLFLR